MRWILGFALGVLGFVLSSRVGAVPTDRQMRDEPEVVLEAGGRSGTADVLTWTSDGRRFLVAGDDKVVRQWRVGEGSLDYEPRQTLRWPAWREQRGGIKALALAPDGKQVAIGGFGLRTSAVVILDRESRNLVAITWPAARPGVDRFNAVTALTYDSTGKRIAFGTADGSLFLWTPEKLPEADAEGRTWSAPQRIGRHDRLNPAHGGAELNIPRAVHFVNATQVVSVAQSGQVLSCPIGPELPVVTRGNAPEAPVLFNINDGRKTLYAQRHVQISPDGKWLVAAAQGPRVMIRSMDGKTEFVLDLPEGHFPRSIAFDATKERLAVAVGSILEPRPGMPRFFLEQNDSVRIYSRVLTQPTLDTTLAYPGKAEALAWRPGHTQLAIAGGDADEVRLIDLQKPEQPWVSRGAGRKIFGVQLDVNGLVARIQTERNPKADHPNQLATGESTILNLAKLEVPRRKVEPQWHKPAQDADGWTIVPDEKSRFRWFAVHAQHGRHLLPLDQNRDQAPTCYAFLPARDNQPTRVLVGHYYGVSLFSLGVSGAERTKLYTGHMAEVLSIAPSRDQTWFLTGGADQTVCAWKLTDWPGQAILGATFTPGNETLTIKSVEVGSPAYDAGLSVGETLSFLAIDARPIFGTSQFANAKGSADADQAATMLSKPIPGVELYFEVVAKGGGAAARRTLTTVRQRPIWKWFPGFSETNVMTDWVIWMAKGSYYHTPTPNGDRLVGWHVNHPELDGKPEFYHLNQFREIYQRLDVVEEIVNTQSVEKALNLVWEGNPQPIPFRKYEPAPLQLALNQRVLRDKGVSVQVRAERRGQNPDLLPERVELWINDYRHQVWKPQGKGLLETLELDAKLFQTGDNTITVLSFNAAGGRAEVQQVLTNPRSTTTPRLLGVAVGVNNYGEHRKTVKGDRQGFSDLINAVKDARSLSQRLDDYRGEGKYFGGQGLTLKLNAEASRETVLQQLADLARTAGPDDHLVVFLAGHGDLLDEEGRPYVPDQKNRKKIIDDFIFCCSNYSPADPRSTSVSAKELVEALAQIPCRKTIFLDACRAGQAAQENVIRKFVPNGLGPTIIAACNAHETSYENPDPINGQGIFTQALLDALGKDYRKVDRNSDGVLTTQELFQFLEFRVPEMSRALTRGDVQHPTSFPRLVPQTVFVKK